MFVDRRFNIVKMSALPNLVYLWALYSVSSTYLTILSVLSTALIIVALQ